VSAGAWTADAGESERFRGVGDRDEAIVTFQGGTAMADVGNIPKKYILNGVSVIGSKRGDQINAMSAAWVCRASIDPPLVMVGIGFKRRSYPMIKESGFFTISILREDQVAVAKHFGRTPKFGLEKFEACPYEIGQTGAPLLKDCLAIMECRIVSSFPTGDHEWFVGEILREEVRNAGKPLVYRHSDYD
jgi:flavin reductase (DIM6/NTAB) family NADH-FMN oxidoreductase RutF